MFEVRFRCVAVTRIYEVGLREKTSLAPNNPDVTAPIPKRVRLRLRLLFIFIGAFRDYFWPMQYR
jgi:hypothetical protein